MVRRNHAESARRHAMVILIDVNIAEHKDMRSAAGDKPVGGGEQLKKQSVVADEFNAAVWRGHKGVEMKLSFAVYLLAATIAYADDPPKYTLDQGVAVCVSQVRNEIDEWYQSLNFSTRSSFDAYVSDKDTGQILTFGTPQEELAFQKCMGQRCPSHRYQIGRCT